ncbi:unnamed protein product [Symbiodinium natans]|uniref:Uncharacterized protein n=1 Tax=Symbiodinium natans TaxID=878477 RepID=A0A812I149_9DINO|nr:unnamed protein product [Symbiodinium natans]
MASGFLLQGVSLWELHQPSSAGSCEEEHRASVTMFSRAANRESTGAELLPKHKTYRTYRSPQPPPSTSQSNQQLNLSESFRKRFKESPLVQPCFQAPTTFPPE